MSQERWTAVDRYLGDLLVWEKVPLDSDDLPPDAVTPVQGKLLHLLARIQGARSILEMGTLGGYSTIWLARALPDGGHLVTLESDPRHVEAARAGFERAGLAGVIELLEGDAQETLAALAAAGRGPFDLIFIDADKRSNPEYFRRALELSRRGTLIVADNVIRDGEVASEDSDDPDVQGVRRFLELVAAEPRVSATAIQTVGSKGHDGFALLLVTA